MGLCKSGPPSVADIERCGGLFKGTECPLKLSSAIRQCRPSCTDIGQTARGAILIFLLLQLTHNATDGQIGVANPFSQYARYLPHLIPLPTVWNKDEQALLEGTSLEAALKSKIKSLNAEFDHLQEKTAYIEWCKQHWWAPETGQLSLNDWVYLDAAYRSRALDMPGIGHSTVPCIDMANHASGFTTVALYDTDAGNNAILVLREGKEVDVDEEVTITYGDGKGACEMLFSYGFIEEGTSTAGELYLDVDIPDDDPLKLAKKSASRSPPGFRLFKNEESLDWEGPFVWLLCVNEEDGLEFKLMQSNDGEREILLLWKGHEVDDMSVFQELLSKDKLWDIFQLRATTIVHSRLEQQLLRLRDSEQRVEELQGTGDLHFNHESYAMELRDLEESLMLEAYEILEDRKTALLNSPKVLRYLGVAQKERPPSTDDFS